MAVLNASLPKVDRRTLVAAGLASLAALLVLALTRPEPSVPVLFAAREIPAGQPLEAGSVAVRTMPSGDGFVVGDSVGELVGWSLAGPVAAGEPILSSQLREPGAATTRQSMSLALPASHAALGSVTVGEYVDIYVTWPSIPGEARSTELLAEAVLVLETRTIDGAGGDSVALLLAVDDHLAPLIAGGLRVGELDLVRVAP